jgi:hypothetical protein
MDGQTPAPSTETTTEPAPSAANIIERADGSRLHLRRAKRTQMAKLMAAADMQTYLMADGSTRGALAEQLRFQELCVRWGIERIEGGPFADAPTTNHPTLGTIAPEGLYDDLTDEELARIGDIVQG